MEETLPMATLAHFVMKVDDVETSYRFYADLGLRPLDVFPGMAIIELRGGTHLLLFQKDDDQSDDLHASRTGQLPASIDEVLDLMIAGNTKSDLEQYRERLIMKGFSPSEVAIPPMYGHHHFSVRDPDGNGITFYTNHCGEHPV